MGRLIDVDELEKFMTEDWFLENLAAQDSKSAIKKDILNALDNQPTAYDVETVVAELENFEMWKELLIYDLSHREREIIKKAISIVRGKE